MQLHVEEGRANVNYSEWDRPQEEGDESAETVVEGEMPPTYYTLLTQSEGQVDRRRATRADRRAQRNLRDRRPRRREPRRPTTSQPSKQKSEGVRDRLDHLAAL
jgi:hypothetical protein